MNLTGGIHLWCEQHRLVVVFPYGWWEREAGADEKEENPQTVAILLNVVFD